MCLSLQVATGYAPTLIQMYATAEFGFSQGDNGYLMAGNALMRAFFLILLFPRIIARGRAWFAARAHARRRPGSAVVAGKTAWDGGEAARGGSETADGMLPTDPRQFEAPSAAQADEGEPVVIPDPAVEKLACQFDLFFLRWSLLVDGLLTAVTAFATRGWHVYLGTFFSFLSSLVFFRCLGRGLVGPSYGPYGTQNKLIPVAFVPLPQLRFSCPSAPARRRPPRESSPRCARVHNEPTRSTP